MSRPLTLGFLHTGPESHGVRRFGRLLADQARRHGVDVVEADVPQSAADARGFRVAADRLASCDIVHLQYNCQPASSVWGAGWSQLYHLATFLRRCVPAAVVTLHDVYGYVTPGAVLGPMFAGLGIASAPRGNPSYSPPSGGGRSDLRRLFGRSNLLRAATLRFLLARTRGAIVCSHEERRRLRSVRGGHRVAVIPHFVEMRSIQADSVRSKADLGLQGRRVVTLLGYLHPRKGWRILLDALRLLPDDVVVVFAGSASPGDDAVRAIQRLAVEHGIESRVRITGFLSEEELDVVLAATDLAVCPFSSVSASGSVSTWISVPRPILASELPLFAEYNAMVPGSIDTFAPYDAATLASRIAECLATDGPAAAGRLVRLRSELAIGRTMEAHLALYRDLLTRT